MLEQVWDKVSYADFKVVHLDSDRKVNYITYICVWIRWPTYGRHVQRHVWIQISRKCVSMGPIDQSHKSHNAPAPVVHISVTKWCTMAYLFHTLWGFCNGSIDKSAMVPVTAYCSRVHPLLPEPMTTSFLDANIRHSDILLSPLLYFYMDELYEIHLCIAERLCGEITKQLAHTVATQTTIVRCRFNAINFRQNPYKYIP